MLLFHLVAGERMATTLQKVSKSAPAACEAKKASVCAVEYHASPSAKSSGEDAETNLLKLIVASESETIEGFFKGRGLFSLFDTVL